MDAISLTFFSKCLSLLLDLKLVWLDGHVTAGCQFALLPLSSLAILVCSFICDLPFSVDDRDHALSSVALQRRDWLTMGRGRDGGHANGEILLVTTSVMYPPASVLATARCPHATAKCQRCQRPSHSVRRNARVSEHEF